MVLQQQVLVFHGEAARCRYMAVLVDISLHVVLYLPRHLFAALVADERKTEPARVRVGMLVVLRSLLDELHDPGFLGGECCVCEARGHQARCLLVVAFHKPQHDQIKRAGRRRGLQKRV